MHKSTPNLKANWHPNLTTLDTVRLGLRLYEYKITDYLIVGLFAEIITK